MLFRSSCFIFSGVGIAAPIIILVAVVDEGGLVLLLKVYGIDDQTGFITARGWDLRKKASVSFCWYAEDQAILTKEVCLFIPEMLQGMVRNSMRQ